MADATARRAAMYLKFLARLGSVSRSAEGLTNAQWAALNYFGSVNRFSRTLPGFAGFHSATLGSASQTINRLVKKGLLVRIPDEIDGRRVRFDLSQQAQAVPWHSPPEGLVQAISTMPQDRQAWLEETLKEMLSSVYERYETAIMGRCDSCKFRKEQLSMESHTPNYFCLKVNEKLTEPDAEFECVHYVPRDAAPDGQHLK